MRWRAWYTEGRLFDSSGTAWADLPADGMLAVEPIQDPPYRRIVKGGDWYWLDADGVIRRVVTHTEWGRWAPAPEGVPPGMLKRSGALPDDEWQRFHDSIAARA